MVYKNVTCTRKPVYQEKFTALMMTMKNMVMVIVLVVAVHSHHGPAATSPRTRRFLLVDPASGHDVVAASTCSPPIRRTIGRLIAQSVDV